MPETGKTIVSRDLDFDEGTETRENEKDTIEFTNGVNNNGDEQVQGVLHLSEIVAKKFDTNTDTPSSTSDDSAEEKAKKLDEDRLEQLTHYPTVPRSRKRRPDTVQTVGLPLLCGVLRAMTTRIRPLSLMDRQKQAKKVKTGGKKCMAKYGRSSAKG